MKKKGKFFAAMLAVALILCLVTVALAACGDKNTQKHEHTFAEEWSHNDDYHWHAATCGHTDQVQDKASHDFDWQEVTPASCDQKGRKKGTCECGYVTYEDIEMTAHTLTPGWTWSGYTSATLKLTCTECEDVIATVPATLSSESGSDACAEYTLHTATATYDGETYTNSKREESVSHHTYALSEWKWDDDLSGAVAVLVCERDATHVYESARVSSEENDHLDPTCTENGYTDYKVRLELDGATYEGTKQNGGIQRKEIDTLGHDFDTEWLHNASEHWHKCSRCTETDAHIAHTYTDGICACGYAELTPEDEFVFSEIDGKWAITGYRGNRSVVTIPATYRGRDVVELGMGAFYGNTSLKHVVIPDAITSMRDGVFDGCVNIEEVTSPAIDLSSIPKDNLKKLTLTNATRIEAEQFKDYTKLAEINLPVDDIVFVGKDAFANTAWLKAKKGVVYIGKVLYTYVGTTPNNFELSVKDDTIAISPSAFEGKTIYQVTIPSGVSIGANAFKDTNIQRAIISTSAIDAIPKADLRYLEITSGTTISQGTLKDCKNLQELVLPFVGGSASATSASASTLFGYLFASVQPTENANYYREIKQQYGEGSSESVTYYIPSSIRNVTIKGGQLLYGAFYGCISINTLNIGEEVTSIGDFAFRGCTSLKEIIIPDSVTSIGSSAFENCTGLQTATINAQSIGNWAFCECYGLQTVTIGEGVTSIGDYAFRDCTGLQTVTIGEGVQSIGKEAFEYCTGITKVNVTSLKAWCEIEFHYSANPLYVTGGKAQLYCNGELVDFTNLNIPNGTTKIGSYAFYGFKGITSVTIPDSVTSIGYCAFYGCTGLQTVTIPDSVTSIGDNAFYNCTNLQTLTIGEGVQSIGKEAFYQCTSLHTVTINAKSIGDGAFYGCTGLSEITIPGNVTRIGNSAFYNCTGLQTLTIGSGVKSIGDYAFRGCTGLQTVTIGEGVTSIGNSAFRGCTGLQTVNWNATNCTAAGSSGYQIFNGCTGLTTVNIGENVQSIPANAFYGCKNIATVTYPASAIGYIPKDSLTTVTITSGEIGKSAFSQCTGLQTVTIGSGVTSIGYSAFYDCKGLSEITIPDSVTSIGDGAFSGCTNITKVNVTSLKIWCGIEFGNSFANPLSDTNGKAQLYCNEELIDFTNLNIPVGTTKIGRRAFYEFKGITSVTIPDSVTSIGYDAFYGCTGLKKVTIGEGVTSIGDYAFSGCTGITKVNFLGDLKGWCEIEYGNGSANPLSVTGGKAQLYCNGEVVDLTNLNIPNGTTKIGSRAFYGLKGITSVTIPDSVTSIGYDAFYGCTGLKKVTIGEGVTSIGDYAFSGCTDLLTLTIPDSVQSIGSSAFSGCSGLSEITIPESVQSIGSSAFYGCTGLQTVTIGEGVQSIDRSAFSDCTNIATATYPASAIGYIPKDSLTTVTITSGEIGKSAFSYCKGLQTVTIGNGVQSIGYGAFSYCKGLSEITIPDSVTSIGDYAFESCWGLQTVTIGEGVQSIGGGAFYDCKGLTDIYYAGNATQWKDIKKSSYWDNNTSNYQLHYNSTGPAAASAASNIATLPSEQAVLIACDKLNFWAKQN